MSVREVIERTARPVTPVRITRQLGELGVRTADILLVHTSLSKLGWVPGGPPGIIEAVIDSLGAGGTLVMPTFTTGNSDPATWRDPAVPSAWFEEIRQFMPAFDPRTSPTRNMGRINEAFRSWRGVVRSAHPQVSFAGLGPFATHILAPHEHTHAFDEESPLARLYAADAKILFLGTGYPTCTSFHLAESRADRPGKQVSTGAAMMVDGRRAWVEFAQFEGGDDFAVLGEQFEHDTGAVAVGRVGEAECRLFPMRSAVDYAVGWLRANRSRSG